MLGNLNGWHFLIILLVILLLFGAPKLPALARSLGQSMNILKKEIRPEQGEKPSEPGTADSTAIDPSGSSAPADQPKPTGSAPDTPR